MGLEFNDLLSEDSGRDEAGYTHHFVIREEVKTWNFVYSWLTAEEYTYIRSLLRGKHNFQFTFKDEEGKQKTVMAHCQQKSVSYWSARRGLYKDLQFEITED